MGTWNFFILFRSSALCKYFTHLPKPGIGIFDNNSGCIQNKNSANPFVNIIGLEVFVKISRIY